MLSQIILFIFGLCWGSFLNVVGYRLIKDKSFFARSACPRCKKNIAWYDLIPVLSWLLLRAQCRACHKKISVLYPVIELLTAIVLTASEFLISPSYWTGSFIFFSALIVTIRTDVEFYLISRYMTLWMIPVALLLCSFKMLPISILNSILGAIFGYIILWFISQSFKRVRKKDGLGQGDLDLLAMIGAFTGIIGTWFTLFLGALFGTVIGTALAIKHKRRDIKIAFGPWLALGAMLYVLFNSLIAQFIFAT